MKLNYSTRQICQSDIDFVFHVHKETLGPYVDLIWGWNDANQYERIQNKIGSDSKIIRIDGEDVGYLDFEINDHSYVLNSILLLPKSQGRGVGSYIINTIMEMAKQDEKPVRLRVFKINPAKNLYERLGFTYSGETEFHFQMEWNKS